MNSFINGLKSQTNYGLTENGGIKYLTTKSDLLDMFAMGGAMRGRSEFDIQLMFKNAYNENPLYALRCLFYLRDIRSIGQGERRFFRICLKWLAQNYPKVAKNIISMIPYYGRWDDLYTLCGTELEDDIFKFIEKQLAIDIESKAPSLLAKWLKSEKASSQKSRILAKKTARALRLTNKQYRILLSSLRERIRVLERLMSENRWEEIEFDKLPSKAGFKYKNAFARHDVIKEKYKNFIRNENTKVNAKTLYPYECVDQAFSYTFTHGDALSVERDVINKYWDNLKDYFNGHSFNGIAVIDTSSSMMFGGNKNTRPIDVAISLGLYCAERNKGPFGNYYISFSNKPQLIRCDGIDFCDKVKRIYETNLVQNTNIEAVFDLLLDIICQKNVLPEDVPENIIIISDMEFDDAVNAEYNYWDYDGRQPSINSTKKVQTVMEQVENKWNAIGYQLPHIIYWNVDARHSNIPAIGNGYISYVSGFSPSTFEIIMSGKTGMELMYEALNSERYSQITKEIFEEDRN